ncbi:Rieske (2Fe-2S) protein [Paenibacillus sp. GCM10023248]|uniref:Rieske (2Fe-2S) protein n=1 Tax=Bacillales TaxID=1385 RepID=UPI002378516E|nr:MULTISPECIES: Rieske (2Fe-2S) protein [Bacillales]MDD9266921.1 Rieske (2Fe-2S) protein [Paenibacillus sp. MAHUQ-63]MDR6881119.1 nitrite reductase/ring-hydroxylating ferredoxin subunit [Bacillus sp. 3255]
MKEVQLGSEQSFTKLPAEVVHDKNLFWLIQTEDGQAYKLLSSRCPHAGAIVEAEKGEFVCPMHGWTFDLHSGACLNVPTKSLLSYDVVVKEGQLIAYM